MKRAAGMSVIPVLLILCLAATTACGEQVLSQRTQQLFGWFDKLGFDDIRQAKFIRIRTGYSVTINGVTRQDEVSDGFLLVDDGATFRAVLADLTTGTLTKAGKDKADPAYCGFEELDLETYARVVSREIKKPKYFELWDGAEAPYYRYQDRLDRPGQVFVLARQCALRGAEALAEEMVKALLNSPEIGKGQWSALRDRLDMDFAGAMRWRAEVAFRDGSKSWADLAAEQRRIAELFPETVNARWAQEMAAKIERLVAEEKAHKAVEHKSLSELPAEEQAREWVWRLRDEQDSASDASDTWPRPWAQPVRTSNGAMDALRKLGIAAVPALLAELHEEERLSRSITRSSRYGGVIWTTSTQDLAISVLNDISGLQFYYLGHWRGKPEEKWPRIRAVVEEWWQVTKTGGEKAWLAQAVRGGGRRASECVELLVSRYPDDFLEAAIAGFVASLDSDDAHPATVLLKKLAEHRRPQVEAMLIEQMKSAKRTRDCLAMAYVLRKWEQREADTVIRARWEEMVSRGLPDPKTTEVSRARVPFDAKDAGPVELLVYLAGSDTSARMVLDAWPTLRSEYRLALVDALVGPGSFESNFPDGPAQRVFLQELLLTALEDTEEYWGRSTTYDDGTIVDPRLCDVAAEALHKRWPEKYAFERFATRSQRDHQRLTMMNRSRRELGRQEVALPPMRAKVLSGKERTIAAMEWDENSFAADANLNRRVEAWKGKPINVEAVISAVTSYAKKPLAGTRGLRVTVESDGDSTGVLVRLRLIAGTPQENGSGNFRMVVYANKAPLLSNGHDDWASFREAIARVLQMPASNAFVVWTEVMFGE